MRKTKPKKHSRPGRRGRTVRARTDGSPRIIAPGKPGNPSAAYWCIAWTERVERDGKQTSRSFTRSTGTYDEKLAEVALQRFNAARARPAEALSINAVIDRYLAIRGDFYQRRKRPPELLANLKSSFRPIRAHFGSLRPSELTTDYVRAYVKARRAARRQRAHGKPGEGVVEMQGTVSDRSISIELANLRSALNRARKDGAIIDAPYIELPEGSAKPRRRALKRTEFARFMRALLHPSTSPHIRTFVMLGVLTGQRSKAIKGLKWDYVDYDEGVIRFTETDPHAASNKRIQDTPLTPNLAAYLLDVQEFALSEWVVEWKGAGVRSVKTGFKALLRRAALDDVRIHDLRRSAATIALNAGGDVGRIALLLNDDEAVVKRNYAHASPDLLLGVVKLIEAEVERASAPG